MKTLIVGSVSPVECVVIEEDDVRVQCPDCPDGSVWDRNGPTNDICPTCNGTAFVWRKVPA